MIQWVSKKLWDALEVFGASASRRGFSICGRTSIISLFLVVQSSYAPSRMRNGHIMLGGNRNSLGPFIQKLFAKNRFFKPAGGYQLRINFPVAKIRPKSKRFSDSSFPRPGA